MFEEGVGRVIGAERRAERADRDAGRLAHGVDEGQDFVRDIGVVLRLHPAAVERVRALVRERIALHAVDAEDSDPPCSMYGLRVRIMPWPSCSYSSPMLVGKASMGMP